MTSGGYNVVPLINQVNGNCFWIAGIWELLWVSWVPLFNALWKVVWDFYLPLVTFLFGLANFEFDTSNSQHTTVKSVFSVG